MFSYICRITMHITATNADGLGVQKCDSNIVKSIAIDNVILQNVEHFMIKFWINVQVYGLLFIYMVFAFLTTKQKYFVFLCIRVCVCVSCSVVSDSLWLHEL